MKKLSLISLVFILISFVSFSQENATNTAEIKNFNELKLNGLFLVLGALDVTYERTLNEESGVGISVFLPIDDDIDGINYYISPYYRFYFGNKYASGFFVEGFGMLNATETYIYNFDPDSFEPIETTEVNTDFALGFGLGGKWTTRKGFIVEVFSGIGRNLFNNNNADYEIIGKGGINIGLRF